MSKIFLVNVGANASHRSFAKSPLFDDGTFVYVSYPNKKERGTKPYTTSAWPYTNNLGWYDTHSDPDWANLTYGDYLANARAASLSQVQEGDILLFWALLWKNDGDNWLSFTKDQSWHLIGALRVEEILLEGQTARNAKPQNRQRALENAHFAESKLGFANRVFVGCTKHSMLFDYAVPLVKELTPQSLLYRFFRTSDGQKLPLNGKHWSSYTRSCRMICDLGEPDGLRRARIARDAIAKRNEFDLLADL